REELYLRDQTTYSLREQLEKPKASRQSPSPAEGRPPHKTILPSRTNKPPDRATITKTSATDTKPTARTTETSDSYHNHSHLTQINSHLTPSHNN
ncbi:uncharacterized, partial [Tachysurus ichikawai]